MRDGGGVYKRLLIDGDVFQLTMVFCFSTGYDLLSGNFKLVVIF